MTEATLDPGLSGAVPLPAPVVPKGRDPRVDVFRGIALVMIFIDHVPDNMYTQYMLWTMGWSDAAEGFVLMSGISAGLAYGLYFRRPMRLWAGSGGGSGGRSGRSTSCISW